MGRRPGRGKLLHLRAEVGILLTQRHLGGLSDRQRSESHSWQVDEGLTDAEVL